MRWFSRRLELAVKIDDSWAFQANGAPHLVIGAFNGWLNAVNDSHEDEPAIVPPRVVGFGRPAAADVVEMEADTSLEP